MPLRDMRLPIVKILLLIWVTGTLQAQAEDAHFVVTNTVVNADLQPFTATIGAIGNGHRLSRDSGFEPLVFRTMMQTTAPSSNQIVASPQAISNWDSWQTGALDGAEVEILRIENGAFRSVRRDRISEGGHQASGWRRVTPRDQVIDPTVQRYDFAWKNWNRPGVPYHFTVRAVDRNGRLSPPARHVSVTAPDAFPRPRPAVENALVEIKSTEVEGRLAVPTNLTGILTDQNTARLAWNPVRGAVGYVIYRSDVPPSEHRGYSLTLEGTGPALKAGDLAIIRTRFLRAERGRRLTHRVWNANQAGRAFKNGLLGWSDEAGNGDWSLVPHDANTQVSEPGETHLRATLVQGERLTVGHWNHSGLDQTWYEVLEPGRTYRFEVWMRGQTTRPVTFALTGFYGSRNARVNPVSFTVTPDWQRYTATFQVPAVHPSRQAGRMQLRLEGPGVFDIDNFRIYRDDAPFLAFLPEDVSRLKASGMGALRTHGFIKTGQATYDLAELTNPGGAANTPGGNTLPQTLAEMANFAMDPWLQIEPHFTREEWLGLAEYLAAPFTRGIDDPNALPWAAKRAAQGQGPWADRFDQILFEIGNETWNRLFAPWTFPPMTDAATGARYSAGAVYGLYQEYVLAILRESPYWPELSRVLVPVIGGWSGSSGWAGFDYGLDATAVSPTTPFMTHAAYNGGWDENAGPATPDARGLSAVLTHVLQTSIFRAERHRSAAARIGAERGAPVFTGTYEAGPGYVMNGLNGRRVSEEEAAQQELAMKSVAAGTATLDAFLMRASYGQRLQNFFTYGSGERWTSHARWNKSGQTYPSWELLALFNTESLGDMLNVETLAAPMIDLPASGRREAVENGPLVAAYATRTEDRLTLFVLSRRIPAYPDLEHDGTTTATVDLPIVGANRLTRISQTGDWQSHNVDGPESRLFSEPIDVPETLPRLTIPALPPGETLVYIFDGIR
ncbi:MAG: carbohydrate binding domain-containing protein [Pseudomonadota bacterium]